MLSKLFNNKKAINDVSIIAIIISIFTLLGFIMPYVNSAFNVTGSEYDTENVADELIGEEPEDVTKVRAGDILKSIGKMFFWTFGDIPAWLDGIFVILRILLIILLIKNFVPFLGGG